MVVPHPGENCDAFEDILGIHNSMVVEVVSFSVGFRSTNRKQSIKLILHPAEKSKLHFLNM